MTSKIDAWKDDKLEREKEAKFIKEYLIAIYEENIAEINNSFVLNLNSPWGYGKTYFLENLKLELEADRHPVIYFDAWKNDFSENALLGFISEIDHALKKYKKEIPKAKIHYDNLAKNGKKILKKSFGIGLEILAKKFTGYELENLKDLLGGTVNISKEDIKEFVNKNAEEMIDEITSKSLKEHHELKEIIEVFKNSLEKITEALKNDAGFKLPMFILVDELDRCRPTYAIELLENIKHIFSANGVFFILATNKRELAHSINSVYGSSFDSINYLKRFFNQEYKLSVKNTSKFVSYLFKKHRLNKEKWLIPFDSRINGNLDLDEYLFEKIAEGFSVGLRDMEQICIQLKSILLTSRLNKIHYPYLVGLLMFRHKNDNEPNVRFENFKDFNLNYHKETANGGIKTSQISFKTIFEFYSIVLSDSRDGLSGRYRNGNYNAHEDIIMHHLLEYFNLNITPLKQTYDLLVDQAGHIN